MNKLSGHEIKSCVRLKRKGLEAEIIKFWIKTILAIYKIKKMTGKGLLNYHDEEKRQNESNKFSFQFSLKKAFNKPTLKNERIWEYYVGVQLLIQ